MRARQVKSVEEVLADAVKQTKGQIDESSVPLLAAQIAEKMWKSEPNTRHVELAKLRDQYATFVNGWIKANPMQSSFVTGEKFEDDALNDLRDLVEKGILHQGVKLRCRDCFTDFWHHVDDLRRTMSCPGCLANVQFPLNPPWTARANELVSGALRQRGVLPVVHALYNLQDSAHSKTFSFIASQDVVNTADEKVLTDVDLMVLVDGELLIGEVKSNVRGFSAAAVKGITTVAKVMLPVEVLFVAEDDGTDWPDEVKRRIDDAAAELSSIGVAVRRELLSWRK
jgi:hypothetical protein